MIAVLKSLVYNGAQSKQLQISDVVLDRLNYELSTIEKLNLVEYFLIYSKIIEICNSHNILRSYGRGSACGSLVNYCLDITKINPLLEGLIFERFLNSDISEFADIDIDIPFGYQKMIIKKLKTVLPEYFIHNVAILPSSNSLAYEQIIIDGNPYKKHPCGIIISSTKMPLQETEYNSTAFYFTDHYSDDLKILNPSKFDILELDYLNKLDLLVNLIGDEYHPYKIPLTDKKVFDK